MTVRLKDEAALKAASSTKLATARTINGTSFDGSANITTSNWGTARTITIGNSGKSVNGSGNVSWSLSEIGAAAASHTHNYAGSSSAGGAANSANKVEIPDTRSVNDTPAQLGASRGISANFKQSATVGLSDGTYSAVMNIVPWSDVSSWSGGKITQMAFSDSGSIYVRKGNGSGWDSWRTIAYTNSSITGNAATATKLQTARTINGTSFDGTGNITTANWGTARTLTVGNTGKSVNGSGNVSWSLSEIGAAPINNAAQHWNAVVKCATWSRIMQFSGATTVGHSAIVTIRGTRGNVVFNFTVMLNSSHSQKGNLVQLNNTSYSNMQLRTIVDSNGNGYLEVYDNANSATNATTQTLNISVLNLTGGTLTKYTAFTDGTTIPTNYVQGSAITTVSGANYTGNAKTATTLQTARTINGTSFNGSANITTANWGTARNIYIADSAGSNTGAAVSVNGAGNATLKLPATIAASLSGNATTATTLQTARTINGTSFNGSANITTANWGTARTLTIGNSGKSVNGSGNVSWSLSEIGAAAASHTHSSLTGTAGSNIAPSTGTGVMRYDYNVSSANAGTLPVSNNANGVLTMNTHSGNYFSQLGFSSNGNLYYRNFANVALNTTTAWKQIAFTSSSITGNAATATALQTARTINGTSFNGSANITTANWGTARTITIGNSAKSVNGSGNVSWTLAEIGAAAASHTHSYLPLSGGTMTGAINSSSLSGSDKNMIKADAYQVYLGSTTAETRLQGSLIHLLGHTLTNNRIYTTEMRTYLSANQWTLNKDVTEGAYTNIYIGPSDTGEARVCAWGSTDGGYRPIRAARYNTSSGSYLETNLSLSGNTVLLNGTNGVLQANAGYLVVRANASQPIYLQGSEVRAVKVNQTAQYVTFRAGNIYSGNVYMNGANSIRNDVRELYFAGTSESYPNYLGSMGISADSAGGRWYSASIYNRKYTASANMHITSNGTVGYTSSARRYKLDIKDVDADKPELILNLEPKTWFDKTATEQYANYLTLKAKGRSLDLEFEDIPYMDRQNGLIAEDVEEAGLGQFVNYGDPDEDGVREVMGIQYDRLWTLLIPVVRDLKKTVEAQQSEINKLKALLKEQVA